VENNWHVEKRLHKTKKQPKKKNKKREKIAHIKHKEN
jgi:hypothetical protein